MMHLQLPYFAVIFVSQRNQNDSAGYDTMAQQMVELAAQQPGYLGIDSVRNNQGQGITISYWDSLESIKCWKSDIDHQVAQKKGKSDWYQNYQVRISRVEQEYEFESKS